MECDFCSEKLTADTCRTIEARSFVLVEFRYHSVGAWCACQTCFDIFKSGDRAALMERSVLTHEAKYGPTPKARDFVRQLHDGLWNNLVN